MALSISLLDQHTNYHFIFRFVIRMPILPGTEQASENYPNILVYSTLFCCAGRC